MALVIVFVSDPVKAAAEMARVVKPGRLVATYMWDIPGGGMPIEPVYAAMKTLGISYPTPAGFATQPRTKCERHGNRPG